MNKEQVTDWKGNIIKEGDEICLIKTKKNNIYNNLSILIPTINGSFINSEITRIDKEDCWYIIEYMKVDKGLIVTSKIDNGFGLIIFRRSLRHILDFMGSDVILAIKGVSDFK